MWARKRVANKRTSFNFIKIKSVEKNGLDNSKKFFLRILFLRMDFLPHKRNTHALKI